MNIIKCGKENNNVELIVPELSGRRTFVYKMSDDNRIFKY